MIYQHLLDRHYNLSNYQHTWVDASTDQVTFPIFSFSGKLVGYQKYNPAGNKKTHSNPRDGKYFTIQTSPGVWGLEYVSTSHPNLMFIVEGVFKACRLHNLGLNAIATLTNNPTHLTQQLRLLQLSYTTVVVPDPDISGSKLIKYGNSYIQLDKPLDEYNSSELQIINMFKELV